MDARRVAARRSVDYPKPESDLAEWATKIKAIQRQVDADEEAEQKRLEAEIAAARQARLRRSRQFSGRGLNVDASPSRTPERSALASPGGDATFDGRSRDAAERSGYQNDALKKLMGHNAVHVPAKQPGEAVSLASFIGGRATGPRLNRHASQQDAHDPTQFAQPDTSAPHPIFGKGGVAMPGMVSKQDLNGGRIASKAPSSTAASSFGQRADDQPKSSALRAPTVAERRRSISPTPAVGSEDFERYRPSPSPTPKSTLKSKKSSESVKERDGKDAGYRYSIIGNQPLRSQKSMERVGSPALRSQKSSERISTLKSQKSTDRIAPPVGSEESERYRPSTSPQPYLRSQKSTTNLASPPETEKRRPVSGSGYLSGRTSPEKRPVSPFKRTASPEKSPSSIEQPAPRPAQLKSQRSWVRDTVTSSPSVGTLETSKSSNQLKTAPAWSPPLSSSKPPSYLTPSRDSNNGTGTSLRERTMSTPASYMPPATIASFHVGRSTATASPMLARPIQPEPRLPANTPVLPPAAVVPSPAFMKGDTAKDVSPSISRLKGRGFVQNMVKASLQLETQSAPSSAQSTPVNKSRQGTGGKKSVLERWQPQMHSASPPPSPTKPQTPGAVRRAINADYGTSKEVEPATTVRPAFSTPTKPSSANDAPEPQRTTASRPAFSSQVNKLQAALTTAETLTPRTTARFMEQMTSSSGQVGSATTMFVQKPATPTPSVSAVDELGVKHEIPVSRLGGRDKHHITSELPASTGKPLIHPTRERAKRPKKNSIPTRTMGELLIKPVEKPQQKAPSMHRLSPQPSQTSNQFAEGGSVLNRTGSMEESKVGRLKNDWSFVGPILPHPESAPASHEPNAEIRRTKYSGIRQALPGMAKEIPKSPRTPEPRITPPSTEPSGQKVPNSPSRHTRIPSTGSRATVMEVAQALHEHAASTDVPAAITPISPTFPSAKVVEEDPAPFQQPRARPPPSVSASAEKRKSSYDRYSVLTLPPLKEEATPAPSPANTLTRIKEPLAVFQPTAEAAVQETQHHVVIEDDTFDVLPKVDVGLMFQPIIPTSLVASDSKTISVDIMSVSGSTSTTLPQATDVFHDTEILAIVHRAKSSGGLVDTFVWCWVGKRAEYGEREEKKVHEIARRYGTTPVTIRQYSEPAHLVKLIGGRLIIRQGPRTHWTSENTTMHLVRSIHGVVFIDEHDLSAKNLCSAFSYCVTVLGTVYVWHGQGSTLVEKEAATKYAELLADGGPVTELHEGQDSEEDASMFWMIIGNDAFANADYWKWRSASPSVDPSLWRVDATKKVNTLSYVEALSQENNPCGSVYIANCVWELFVLVGPNARASRRDIKLALQIALDLARLVSASRPFTPNVHVVIFPSQLPLDLRLHFRDIDEDQLNRGDIPDHMNLVSSEEALTQLQTTVWKPEDVKDHKMLPLGLDASSLAFNGSTSKN